MTEPIALAASRAPDVCADVASVNAEGDGRGGAIDPSMQAGSPTMRSSSWNVGAAWGRAAATAAVGGAAGEQREACGRAARGASANARVASASLPAATTARLA